MDGELFLEQSSELEEEVEVGVMGTVLLLAERIKHKKGFIHGTDEHLDVLLKSNIK